MIIAPTAIIIYKFLFLNLSTYFFGSLYPDYTYYSISTALPLNSVLYKFIPFYI